MPGVKIYDTLSRNAVISLFHRNKVIPPKMVIQRECPVLISIGHINQQVQPESEVYKLLYLYPNS